MSQYKDLFNQAPSRAATPAVNLTPTVENTYPVAPVETNVSPILVELRQTRNIHEIGARQTQQLVALSEQLLAKARATDTGEFGRGMNDILRLMSTVQYDQLGEPSGLGGLINKVKRGLSAARVDIVQAFDSAKGQIDKISQDLRNRLAVIESDNVWLSNAYQANLSDMRALEEILPALEQLILEEQQMPLVDNDPMQNAERRQRIGQLEHSRETLGLQIHQAKLRALQIKGLENANQGIINDFRSLLENAIPAWATEISMGLLSQRQQANLEISNRVKDQIQTSMKRAADQIHDNVLNAEKNLNRQAVDVATLKHVQERTISMIQQKIALAEQHSQQRAQTMQELGRMELELKQALIRKV